MPANETQYLGGVIWVGPDFQSPEPEPGQDALSKETWFRKTARGRCESFRGPVTAMLQMATFAATITFTIILTPRDGDQTPPGLVYIAYANALFCGCIIGCIVATIGIELCLGSLNQENHLARARKLREKAEGFIPYALAQMARNTDRNAEYIWREKRDRIEQILSSKPPPRRSKLSAEMWVHFIAAITGIVGLLQFAAFYLMLYAGLLFLKLKGPFILGSMLYLGLGVLALTSWPFSLWVGHEIDAEIRKQNALEDDMKAVLKILSCPVEVLPTVVAEDHSPGAQPIVDSGGASTGVEA